jgi:hypothetical protein
MNRLVFLLIAALWSVSTAQAQTVSAVSCNPTVLEGGTGEPATCTVTLGTPAPSGGTVVTLTSSRLELAASLPRVTVPAGQTAATFTVATNPGYRRYSLLAFTVSISASANGTTRSATLTVTAQSPPPDFNSGSQAGSNTQWEGLMCGGIAPIGGYPDILYDCSPATGTGFGSCTFREECSLGCRRVPPNGGQFTDACASAGPAPVVLSRNYIVGGDRVSASLVAEAPAGNGPAQETAVPRVIDPNYNSARFPQNDIVFPTGATNVQFEVATSYVPAIQFVEVGGFWFNDAIPPLLITNGRGGSAWLVVLPTDAPPPVALPTMGNFRITGSDPVTGGQQTIGQIDLSGLSRAGGPTISLTSSHPDIVPSMTVTAPANDQLFGFQVFINTNAPAADTDVTITASDGRYSFSDTLRVLAPPPPPVLADLSVHPTSVVGGNASTGTVVLSAAQASPTVVQVSILDTAPATLPSNDPPCPPSSRCHNVTVPAGATSASFTISTSPVSSQFNLNVNATLAGSPGQGALLLITANPNPTVSSLSLAPATVTGGNPSTGTVVLSAAAPAGGALVTLTSSHPSVAAVPASVTVPAGATSASFSVTTAVVATDTIPTITAVYNDTGRTAELRVTAAGGGGGGAPGFLSPTANAPESGGDGNGFESGAVNAHTPDGVAASDINSGSGNNTTCTSSGKDRHRFYNFGFVIPSGTSIAGIEVRLDARADNTSGSPKMCVQLSWDGGGTWTAAKSATLGTSLTAFTLGGASDTWGRTWTATNLANASFRLRVINVSSSTSRDFFLDWVGVRVHTAAAASASPSAVSVSRK